MTLGNIREEKRFSHSAWRLAALLPAGAVKRIKDDSELRQEVYHLAVGCIFENYNKLLKEGLLVQCSDGVTRDLAMVLALWQGDQLEVDALCQLVQVSLSMHRLCPGHI